MTLGRISPGLWAARGVSDWRPSAASLVGAEPTVGASRRRVRAHRGWPETAVTVERADAAVGGLLGTKIMPPTVPGGFLRRRRLEDRLEMGVSGPLTVVSAGAGSGKTLLVASWAGTRRPGQPAATDTPARVAWLALDRDDNEPSLFWNGVVAALRAAAVLAADNPINVSPSTRV